MQHWASSDSSYLLASKAHVRVGEHHYLGSVTDFEKPLEDQRTFVNAPS